MVSWRRRALGRMTVGGHGRADPRQRGWLPDGDRQQRLVTPAGLAFDQNGNIYVSNFGIFSGAGEVVRIDY